MNEAFENMGHDMVLFEANITKAAKADPNMLVANFFEAMNPNLEKEATRPFIERVQNYNGELSKGEEVLKEMSTHFDEENYDVFGGMAKLADTYPNDARMYLIAGAAYMYGRKPAKGVPLLKKAAEMGQLPGAYNMLGYGHMAQGDMETAKSYFDKYIELAPNHANPYDSMGDYLMAVKDYKGAAEHFDKAASLNPDQPIHAEKAEKARGMIGE